MVRFVVTLALSALALSAAAAAHASGPSPGLVQGSAGVTGPGQPLRFVTLVGPGLTMLESIERATGRVVKWRALGGEWGVPAVAFDGTSGGLTRDGGTLVLADWGPPDHGALRGSSDFQLVDTETLRTRGRVSLEGDFAFDALSPDGSTLYLVEHVRGDDTTRYRVRAYDLRADRLLRQVIADKRLQGWVMRGYPLKRAESADGRWVYTLYRQDDGYPFVHALDAVDRRAVCIGLPWHGSQDPLGGAQLRLDGGNLLIVAGGRRFAIDTRTYALFVPGRESGFPVGLAAALAAAVAAAAVAAIGTALYRRRERGPSDASGLPA
jgi:hypothetical protein